VSWARAGTVQFGRISAHSAQARKARHPSCVCRRGDTINLVKQAAEFGLRNQACGWSPWQMMIRRSKGNRLELGQGNYASWLYHEDHQRPSVVTTFSRTHQGDADADPGRHLFGVRHYLQALRMAIRTIAACRPQKCEITPVNDIFRERRHIRQDGRMVMNVPGADQGPAESNAPWDLVKLIKRFRR